MARRPRGECRPRPPARRRRHCRIQNDRIPRSTLHADAAGDLRGLAGRVRDELLWRRPRLHDAAAAGVPGRHRSDARVDGPRPADGGAIRALFRRAAAGPARQLVDPGPSGADPDPRATAGDLRDRHRRHALRARRGRAARPLRGDEAAVGRRALEHGGLDPRHLDPALLARHRADPGLRSELSGGCPRRGAAPPSPC